MKKQTAKQKILAIAKTLPDAIETKDVSLAEQLSDVLERIAQSSTPVINVPKHEKQPAPIVNVAATELQPIINVTVPETIPVVKVESPEIVLPEQNIAKEWDFTIHRLDNGLIDSIKAKRVG